MPSFRVTKAFYYAKLDSVLLAGSFLDSEPVAMGWQIELPDSIKGRAPVPIHDRSAIQFADGTEQMCLIVKYESFVDSPLLEFRDLEGLDLKIKRRE